MASGEGSHHHGDLGPDPFAPTPTRKVNTLFSPQFLSPSDPAFSAIPPLGQSNSPEAVKAQLQQHLAETEKRIEAAGRLGTSLVKQQQELAERLREVEEQGQNGNGEISEELTRKLMDIEREFENAGRDSSRMLASKSRQTSGEMGVHAYEAKVCALLCRKPCGGGVVMMLWLCSCVTAAMCSHAYGLKHSDHSSETEYEFLS